MTQLLQIVHDPLNRAGGVRGTLGHPGWQRSIVVNRGNGDRDKRSQHSWHGHISWETRSHDLGADGYTPGRHARDSTGDVDRCRDSSGGPPHTDGGADGTHHVDCTTGTAPDGSTWTREAR